MKLGESGQRSESKDRSESRENLQGTHGPAQGSAGVTAESTGDTFSLIVKALIIFVFILVFLNIGFSTDL